MALMEVGLRNIRLLEQLSEGTGIREGLGHSLKRLNRAHRERASWADLHVVDAAPGEKPPPRLKGLKCVQAAMQGKKRLC